MGFTGAHMLYVLDVFILALYLLSHVCALLEYTFQHLIQPSQGAGEADLKVRLAFMRICENEFVLPLLDLTLQMYNCESAIIGR